VVKSETITQQGTGALNEDAIIYHPEAALYGVLDGVSSLVPYVNSKKETGGFIAANLVKSCFESLTHTGNLQDHIIKVNTLLREQMMEANIDAGKKEELWGTALAIVRLQDDGVEYIQTGDCMILAVYEDGEVRPLTRTQVSHLEAAAFVIWQDGITKGLKSRTELHATIVDTIKKNRYQSNRAGGYGVLNGEEEAACFLEYGKINLTCLKHLILLTDGMFLPPAIVSGQGSYWSCVAECILNKGIKQYTEELIEREESDSECIRYIRFKKSDDKTAMVISF
jgi:serine/threonine protein phosphatase PrpC